MPLVLRVRRNVPISQRGWISPSRAILKLGRIGYSNPCRNVAPRLLGTGTSTVKSQMNAVFRKGDVENRQQLIAYFVDEFLAGAGETPPDARQGG